MKVKIMAVAAVLVGLVGCERAAQRDVEEETVQRGDCIETHCVVAYYQDDVPYWTDQRHQFCPSAVLLEAWGVEPEAKWKAVFRRGQFSRTGLNGAFAKTLPGEFINAALAELMYYSFTAGAGFLPDAMAALETISIEGQRYEAFRVGKSVTLYKNAVTGQFELVRTTADGVDWMARSYNLRYQPRLGRPVPRKIDILDVQRGVSAKQLLIQIDYIDVR